MMGMISVIEPAFIAVVIAQIPSHCQARSIRQSAVVLRLEELSNELGCGVTEICLISPIQNQREPSILENGTRQKRSKE